MRRAVENTRNGRVVALIALTFVLAVGAWLTVANIRHPTEVRGTQEPSTATALPIVPIARSSTSAPFPTLPAAVPVTASSNGYTVTVYPVSADASRVLITYTLTAPTGHNANAVYLTTHLYGITRDWELAGPSLSEGSGTFLPARITTASEALDGPMNVSAAPPISATKAIAFDRTRRPNTASVLPFHLTGDLAAVKATTSDSVFRNPITETVASNLNFDFPLPLNNFQRKADVNQTFQAGGIALTLDRVGATPFETVLYMHGRKEQGSDTDFFQGDLWPSDLQINTAARQMRVQADDYPLSGFNIQHTGIGRLIMYCPGSLLQSDNKWTVSINEIVVAQAHTDTAEIYSGPWVFHFSLPPVTDTKPLSLP